MSPKSVAEKLLIKPNTTVWSSDPAHAHRLGALPSGARLVGSLEEATTAVLFASGASALRTALAVHSKHLTSPATLWVAYPKANKVDINRDTLWPIVAEHGLRPIGQVAVDGEWSALRFRPLAEGEAPFTGGEKR